MIISHKYKFIFVKTAKTAGTSIEVFLSSHCGPLDVVTPIIPQVDSHMPRNHEGYYNHIPAYLIRDQIGQEIWNSYFKFCVERNPWEKALSHYYMKKTVDDSALGFSDYLAGDSFPINYSKYTEPDEPGTIIVDKVLQYENLMDQLCQVFKALGVPFRGSLGVNAKSEYRSDRRTYSEVYTQEQAELVRAIFAQEIRLHGYEF